ncbi:MAG: restriction endonuclease subunit S [Akkermansia muciniphila]|nr:restriction endonuclease subunit S [Akkermansia muciniphila]
MRAMKNSGVEWIGEIPVGWSLMRLKSLFNFGKGLAITKENLIENGTPVISYGQIHSKENTGTGLCDSLFRFVDTRFLTTSPQSLVKKGDFIIADTSEDLDGCGNCVYVDDDTVLFAGYHTIILKTKYSKNNKYLSYLFKSDNWRSQIRSRVSGVKLFSISQKILNTVTCVFPSQEEQASISILLDTKCAEIDKVVEQTRATIEEYKKLKQAIITEAVTKGVRGPRPMKPSGVEWIGDIPEEWVVLKTLWLLEMPITDGPHETPTLYDEGIPFISAEAVSCGRGRIDFSHKRGYISKEYYDECCKKYTPRLHDIYMIKSGATTGRVSMVDTEEVFTIWSPLAVLRANQEKMLPRFLFYSLQADYYQKQISLSWSFGTQQNIGMRVLEQLKIATPDADEQQEIAAYLDTKCAEIDRIIGKKEQFIEELGSYKKSLIYEYVTGKKQVLYK